MVFVGAALVSLFHLLPAISSPSVDLSQSWTCGGRSRSGRPIILDDARACAQRRFDFERRCKRVLCGGLGSKPKVTKYLYLGSSAVRIEAHHFDPNYPFPKHNSIQFNPTKASLASLERVRRGSLLNNKSCITYRMRYTEGLPRFAGFSSSFTAS